MSLVFFDGRGGVCGGEKYILLADIIASWNILYADSGFLMLIKETEFRLAEMKSFHFFQYLERNTHGKTGLEVLTGLVIKEKEIGRWSLLQYWPVIKLLGGGMSFLKNSKSMVDGMSEEGHIRVGRFFGVANIQLGKSFRIEDNAIPL